MVTTRLHMVFAKAAAIKHANDAKSTPPSAQHFDRFVTFVTLISY